MKGKIWVEKICQRKDLATWFGDIAEKEKSEVKIVAECWEDLSEIWGEELLSLEKITSDFERQNTIGKTTNSAQAVDENDVTHAKILEFEPLLEASGERNLRSINLKHGESPYHCLA